MNSVKRMRRIKALVMVAVFLLTIFANSSQNLIFAMEQTGWQSKKMNLSTLGLGAPETASDLSSAWSNGGGSYLYFGNYVQSGTKETDKKEPIKWRILSTANGQFFLLTDQVLDCVSFNEPGKGEHPYEAKVTDANQYSSSNIRKWLNSWDKYDGSYTSGGFLNTAFSKKEQSYLVEFNKLEDADGDIVNNLQGSSVTGDKVALLSAAEAASGEYGFASIDTTLLNNRSLKATATNYAKVKGTYQDGDGAYYWLRSPNKFTSWNAGVVSDDGWLWNIIYASADQVGVRPAISLDQTKILYNSESGADKTAAFGSIGAASKAEGRMLTLQDGNQLFSAERKNGKTTNVPAGTSMTVSVKSVGTPVGGGSYDQISAMLVDDSDTVICYGKVSGNVTTGDVNVTIPSNVKDGNYKLRVFAEDLASKDGTASVDYASNTADIPVRVAEPEKYQVTVTDGKGSGQYQAEDKVTITANDPAAGKEFVRWQVESGDVTLADATAKTTTFTMPESAVQVRAIYQDIKKYDVTVIDGTGAGQYLPGTIVTISAGSAPEGKEFVGWQVNSGGVELADPSAQTTTFTMPARDVKVTASYHDIGVQTYQATVVNGSGAGKYAEGDTVTITANEPQAGKEFIGWQVESGGVQLADATAQTTTFTMPACAVKVTALYKDNVIEQYQVTVVNGSGAGKYAAGATVTIKANAVPEGKEFAGWRVDSGSVQLKNATAQTTTFTMPARDVKVTALYKDKVIEQYQVMIDGGQGAGLYAAGDTVTITADAAPEGKEFAGWRVDSGNVQLQDATAQTTTFTMPTGLVNITALYRDSVVEPVQTYQVTVISGSGSGLYAPGDTVTITANNPKFAKRFAGWQINSGDIRLADKAAQTTTFVMPESAVQVTATYKSIFSFGNTYNHEAEESNSANDAVAETPQKEYEILDGANQKVTANYAGDVTIRANGDLEKFLRVYVDGVLVAEKNYSLKSGSTILTLGEKYIQGLTPGEHLIHMEFTDGYAETHFYKEAPLQVTNTEDGILVEENEPTGTWFLPAILLFIMLLLVCIAAAVKNRKRFSKAGRKLFVILLIVSSIIGGVGARAYQATAASRNTITFTCLPELANYVWQGYNKGQYGPVTITKGRLTQDVPEKNWLQQITGHDVQTYDVYLVTLSGTESVENQTTDWQTDLQAGFGFESDYTKNVVQTILANVPEGANLFVAGHSLGGMVAQQVIADEQIKAKYEVKFTVAFGSPAVGQGTGREGQIRRMGVHNDVVPNLSTQLGGNAFGTNWEGDGKYGVNQPIEAHCQGYLRDDILGHWNVCGDKLNEAPDAKLELDLSTLTFYQSLKDATNSGT